MQRSRLTIAKSDIVAQFEQRPDRVMRQRDIAQLLQEHRDFWRLAQSTTTRAFIRYLLDNTKLQRIQLKFPYRPETLYTWGKVSRYVIASRAKPGAYLCHYTAMHLHELTDQVPEVIYANYEQRPLPTTGVLVQEAIDRAFRTKQRVTTNVAELENYKVLLVNGKHTGRLEVIQMQDQDGDNFDVTSLERTLIDIAVRPYYAGGVFEVLEAYRRAAPRVSVNKLAATLKKMEFVYPYEQAIGFYLERTGAYSADRLSLLRRRQFEHDFYLTYAMDKKEYSTDWRLYYPAGL